MKVAKGISLPMLVFILGACGGGGGGGSSSISFNTDIPIDEGNALEVASEGLDMPATTLALAQLTVDAIESMALECDNNDEGGQVSINRTDNDNDGASSSGDRFDIEFQSCEIGDRTFNSGRITFLVDTLQDAGGDFSLSGELSVTRTIETWLSNGTSEDVLGASSDSPTRFPVNFLEDNNGDSLRVGYLAGTTEVTDLVSLLISVDEITQIDPRITRSVAGAETSYADFGLYHVVLNDQYTLGFNGELDSETLDGTFSCTTQAGNNQTPLVGIVGLDPLSGSYQCDGRSGTALIVDALTNPTSQAGISLDAEGDGEFLPFDIVSWSTLTDIQLGEIEFD